MPPRKPASTAPAAVHVALLRGINVGGKHCLPMKSLASIFEDVGCSKVRTYIQSGNVVFEATDEVARVVSARVSDLIAHRFGFCPPVVSRTAAELRSVASSNPFVATSSDPEILHVAFLGDLPSDDRLALLKPDRSPPDSFVVQGREIFLRCPDGLARTKLTNEYFDRTLSTTSTVRNWRTVLALVKMVNGG